MLKQVNIPIEVLTPTFDKDNLNFEIKIGTVPSDLPSITVLAYKTNT